MSLKLWKLDPHGLRGWTYERNVDPGTADEWLSVFRRQEPSFEFRVSAQKPRSPARKKIAVKEGFVGRTASVTRFIPGHPSGVPSGAFVEIEEIRKSRGSDDRIRVLYRGSSFWVDADAIRLLGSTTAPARSLERRRKKAMQRRDSSPGKLALHYNRLGEYPWEVWQGRRVAGRFHSKLDAIRGMSKIRTRSSRPTARSKQRPTRRARRAY